ncbi:ectoine synthase [Paucisalibacillus sp. EB02]|uniref:ectoine synthase n=1 Tax=Paucisalibacillus sp. EB02 TaxID=1347087 RepID=UPI0004BBA8FE|nr:ectoine synthase [Paucisalibacillus sp. EB02]
MIVKKLAEVFNTKHDVHGETWNSRRLLIKSDGMGYSMTDTLVKQGTETYIWYKNHLEACYCIEGEGEVELADENGDKTGEVYQIAPGTVYALNENDRHFLRATTADLRLVCVFNPPLTGEEVHDEDGSYQVIE